MDLKAVVLFVCLAALCFTSTEAAIPKCCLQTTKYIPRKLLAKVEKWVFQPSNGVCDIAALVLYVSGRQKPVCADPKIFKRKLRCRGLLGLEPRIFCENKT